MWKLRVLLFYANFFSVGLLSSMLMYFRNKCNTIYRAYADLERSEVWICIVYAIMVFEGKIQLLTNEGKKHITKMIIMKRLSTTYSQRNSYYGNDLFDILLPCKFYS